MSIPALVRAVLSALVVVVTGALAHGCTHTPTAEEIESARARYNVGLALVHEARRAGTIGDGTTADLKWRQALAELMEAEKVDPTAPDTQYLLGMTYFVGFRRHVDAERHLRRAIETKKAEYPEAEYLLGTLLVDADRPRDAVPHLERARTNLLYETPYFAEQELGWAKFKLADYAGAARHLQNAIVAQPDLCGAYVRLADVEEARDDQTRAREVLEEFVTRCDSERLRAECGPKLLAYAHYRLGMSRLKGGAHDDARASFEACTTRFAAEPVAKECARSLELLP